VYIITAHDVRQNNTSNNQDDYDDDYDDDDDDDDAIVKPDMVAQCLFNAESRIEKSLWNWERNNQLLLPLFILLSIPMNEWIHPSIHPSMGRSIDRSQR